jgi:cystathionine gamma-synthase
MTSYSGTDYSDSGFNTRAIHAGQEPDEQTGAVTVPIHVATTYAQQGVNQHKGFEYSRTGNPTRQALEHSIAALEGATHGFAFGSGMGAEDAILRMLQPGDNVLLGNDAYGGTFRLLDKIYGKVGVTWTAVDLTKPDLVASSWADNTKLVWMETPTNPNLTVFDIEAISAAAHLNGGLCVVDNTFATPYLQQPISMGADIVVHSATKYLGGHSDVVGGLVVTNNDELAEHLAFVQNGVGAIISPFDCYFLLRGVKTLGVRMDRHCDNAQAIVAMLSEHPAIEQVLYPGLPGHLGHETASRQMRNYGGMVSFIPRGGAEAAHRIVTSTKLFTLAESLGAVESLIEVPAGMTHGSTAGSPLEVDPALVRLSVGIEDIDDLLNDLQSALG